MVNQMKAGKQLVAEILRDLAQTAGVQPDDLKWEWGSLDFDHPPGSGIKSASRNFHSLAVLVAIDARSSSFRKPSLQIWRGHRVSGRAITSNKP
jgi:hypothetical protein